MREMEARLNASHAPGGEPLQSRIPLIQPCIYEFSPSIQLMGWNDEGEDLLTPLGIGDSKGRTCYSLVKFKIRIRSEDHFRADQATIQILENQTIIYEELHTSKFVTAGDWIWEWDGYDSNGMLDTARLKSDDLAVKLLVTKNSQTHSDIIQFNNTHQEAKWVDAKIYRTTGDVEVTVRVTLNDRGLTSRHLPPTGINFQDIRLQAIAGIEKYWSRSIILNGRTYNVKVKVVPSDRSAMTLDIKINANPDPGSYERSNNPGGGGFVSGVVDVGLELGNLIGMGVGSRVVVYNMAYIMARGGQDDFKIVAAHEFGHRVLTEFYKVETSWGHKETSGLIFQNVHENSKYPTVGEIDIMKYYNEKMPLDYYQRLAVVEKDVKALIWLSRVDFDDKKFSRSQISNEYSGVK
jgi:hypothetical protein